MLWRASFVTHSPRSKLVACFLLANFSFHCFPQHSLFLHTHAQSTTKAVEGDKGKAMQWTIDLHNPFNTHYPDNNNHTYVRTYKLVSVHTSTAIGTASCIALPMISITTTRGTPTPIPNATLCKKERCRNFYSLVLWRFRLWHAFWNMITLWFTIWLWSIVWGNSFDHKIATEDMY